MLLSRPSRPAGMLGLLLALNINGRLYDVVDDFVEFVAGGRRGDVGDGRSNGRLVAMTRHGRDIGEYITVSAVHKSVQLGCNNVTTNPSAYRCSFSYVLGPWAPTQSTHHQRRAKKAKQQMFVILSLFLQKEKKKKTFDGCKTQEYVCVYMCVRS